MEKIEKPQIILRKDHYKYHYSDHVDFIRFNEKKFGSSKTHKVE